MYRQPPEHQNDPARAGLLESVAARFALEDAARTAWLDARIRERRVNGRRRPPCVGCGLKIGHHPGCIQRGRDADEGRDTSR
jgi:hypothetical protein